MLPIKTLQKEHKVITKVLNALERLVSRIKLYQRIDVEILGKSIEFVKYFTDRCHYSKEEEVLFHEMQERGVSYDYGPLGVLVHEHEAGRAYIRQLEEGIKRWQEGEKEALEDIINSLANYVVLSKQHIEKENTVLYPMAEKMFNKKESKKLSAAFARFETRKSGKNVCCQYHYLADDIDRSILN